MLSYSLLLRIKLVLVLFSSHLEEVVCVARATAQLWRAAHQVRLILRTRYLTLKQLEVIGRRSFAWVKSHVFFPFEGRIT